MLRHGRILLAAWLLLGAGCSMETVRWFTTCTPCNNSGALTEGALYARDRNVQEQVTLALAKPGLLPEDDLLDVDIRLLRPMRPPGMDFLDPFFKDSLGSLRQAESYYLSEVLANKMQRSGHWGRVLVNPYGLSGADLEISGRIEQSDGQMLRIRIEARDSTGASWLAKRYVQTLPPLAPRSGLEEVSFPFNDLLNAIANDLARVRAEELSSREIALLRNNSLLKFAAELAPAAYAPYRQDNTVLRLPAQDDPVFLGVQEIRVYNETFLDAMQAGQEFYARQVAPDYLRFLDRSRQATQQINDYYLEAADGRTNLNPDSKGNMNFGRYKGLYSVALADVNQPIEERVTPVSVEFSDRSAELTGTIEEQFRQWQVILQDMYETETGIAP